MADVGRYGGCPGYLKIREGPGPGPCVNRPGILWTPPPPSSVGPESPRHLRDEVQDNVIVLGLLYPPRMCGGSGAGSGLISLVGSLKFPRARREWVLLACSCSQRGPQIVRPGVARKPGVSTAECYQSPRSLGITRSHLTPGAEYERRGVDRFPLLSCLRSARPRHWVPAPTADMSAAGRLCGLSVIAGRIWAWIDVTMWIPTSGQFPSVVGNTSDGLAESHRRVLLGLCLNSTLPHTCGLFLAKQPGCSCGVRHIRAYG